jgi:hypothetical protein
MVDRWMNERLCKIKFNPHKVLPDYVRYSVQDAVRLPLILIDVLDGTLKSMIRDEEFLSARSHEISHPEDT